MRQSPPSRYPPNFENWDKDRRLHHMTVMYTREGLIRLCFALSRYESAREVDSMTRLKKEELAAIALALDPDSQVPRIDNR